MSASSEESEPETKKIVKSNLQEASKQQYLAAYQQFMTWKSQNSKDNVSEQVLLEYFQEQSETKSPSTLYTMYSMIKPNVFEEHGINIKQCAKLQNFLKQKIVGYTPKKTKVTPLTAGDVEKFLNDAPDYVYLTHKVALLLGVYGACHSMDLCNLTMRDIHKSGKCFIVDLKVKKGTDRTFVIQRHDHLDIIERYLAVRPKDMTPDRFFLKCLKGKCVKQVIGKNRFSEMPSEIAEYLKLPEPKNYRGNCFRMSSSIWYSAAKHLPDPNALCTSKSSEQKVEKITSEVSEPEGILIPAEFLNVAIQVKDTDDDTNVESDVKHCRDDDHFDLEDDAPLKRIKTEKSDSESVSSEQATFPDPLNHEPTADKNVKSNVKHCHDDENFDLEDDAPLKRIKTDKCHSESVSFEHATFPDTLNHEPTASFNTAKKTKYSFNENINLSSKVSINQHMHETTITLPNKTVKLVFKNCKNVSNIRINL